MTIKQEIPKLSLFPLTADVNEIDHLIIGGCDSAALAEEFGTPLYVFDEFSLRSKCAEFKAEFGQRYQDTTVIYASKAFTNKALAILLKIPTPLSDTTISILIGVYLNSTSAFSLSEWSITLLNISVNP